MKKEREKRRFLISCPQPLFMGFAHFDNYMYLSVFIMCLFIRSVIRGLRRKGLFLLPAGFSLDTYKGIFYAE